MTPRSLAAILAGVVTALALWPAFAAHRAPASSPTPAPVLRDYLTRDRVVDFYEREVRQNPRDQILMRMLAGLYLQRFRERYDLTDIARAERLSRASIALQPQGNTAAQMSLASSLLSYHRFREALVHEEDAWNGEPFNANALAQIASLEMELGRYDDARETLSRIRRRPGDNPTVESVRARYDELTGNVARARAEIAVATATIDAEVSAPAYDRSWYHMRAGQLALEAGDLDAADSELQVAIEDYPDNAMALMWQARLYRAQGDWHRTLEAARKSADLYPLPQTLGYKADAERALGDHEAARQTDALIDFEARLYNVQGINDRLLANYYAQRHTHLTVALAAARSDLAKRGDEIYADDTMAWVLAAMGCWKQALPYAQRAVRYGTQDAILQYHAGVVEMRTGHETEGRKRLEFALRLDPRFDPLGAADARRILGD